MLKVTLVHSVIGAPKTQRATVKALGLGKLHDSVLLPDNPQVRGMVRKVVHLVEVEPVPDEAEMAR